MRRWLLRPARTWLLVGAGAVVLLLAGAAASYYFYERHQSADVRGSSTVEFVPTEPLPGPPAPKPAPKPKPGRAQETGGADARRLADVRLRHAQAPVSCPARCRPPFRVGWTFRARFLIEFPPAVAYNRVYVANNPGTLFALDATTGRVRWHFASGRCTAASPAVADGLVYEAFLNKPPCNRPAGTTGIDGEVVAFLADKGKVRWRRRIGPSETSPLVAGGRVYVGDWNGYVYAFDARTGRKIWQYRTDGAVKGGVALSGHRLYVGSYDHNLYALDAGTGRLVWRASSQDRLGSRGTFYSTPAVAYGRVYIGSTDGKVYSFGACERRAALVAVDGRVRLRLAGGLERADPGRLLQRPLLRARRRHRRRQVAVRRPGADLRLGDRARRHRLLLDPGGEDVRARRAHGPPGLELRGRQVLAARRRAGPRVPGRLHQALRPRAAVVR